MKFGVENLACRRGEVTVLIGVTFDVAAGEALILRGPNGSGKTTLLRCLAGLTPPVAGRLLFSTEDVAYAAHADGLKAQLSVAENLQFWADIFGTHDIAPAVEAFELGGLLTRRAQDLSAGQKRRLSLSRLMLTGRAIWALDEPTVSLDAENVARFAAAITAHLAAGGSAILATHIDLGLPSARTLDISPFRAILQDAPSDDPFLDETFS
ncbi:heme ABC exporter ATP-binding protein CcmA [Litoreibacter arenae]|uniref:ABC transporter involved in cytochrome c biogenesis, ATPase component CcmA n=1 Tax=Litoreibacter arenae DSM 19593 TaxID=1123360 RepID=S9QIQ4_9RHOB|nr:heme ABC exporter ATP-binding protein CcmA [Litoreibacter arenae]EPX81351.1 ABC transporter involved in cytochrome c biogenesis, ATPase component CcmA [Litoreibacter arenae DSM 19593]